MDLEALNSGQPGVLLLLKVFFPTSVTIHFISAGEFFTRSHKSDLTGIASRDFFNKIFLGGNEALGFSSRSKCCSLKLKGVKLFLQKVGKRWKISKQWDSSMVQQGTL